MQNEGAQLFVRADDLGAIERAIREYVQEHGCTALSDLESDTPSSTVPDRSERKFLLSQPVHGVVTIWEDGNWADRRLAQALSRALSCATHVLLISDSAVSWGYASYENGRELSRQSEENEELDDAAAAFAIEHRLPYAMVYLEDENLREWAEQFAREHLASPPPISAELIEAARSERELAAPPEEAEEVGVDPEEGDGAISRFEQAIESWQEDFERDRSRFTELRVPC
jgi:hypothetical protein